MSAKIYAPCKQEASSESSVSTKLDNTVKILNTEDTVEDDTVEDDTSAASYGPKKDSSDSSDTEDEDHKAVESSSDYDSSSAKPRKGKRPDSFVSDTSSDYDSVSNQGSRRPQSFVLDEDYDVITEEETQETRSKAEEQGAKSEDEKDISEDLSIDEKKPSEKSSVQAEVDPKKSDDSSSEEEMVVVSSSESDGPVEKETKRVDGKPGAFGEADSDLDGISSLPLPSSMTSTVDLHADQSSFNLDVAQSSVIHSNTLEEIDPLAQDGSAHPSPLTRSSDCVPADSVGSSQGISN